MSGFSSYFVYQPTNRVLKSEAHPSTNQKCHHLDRDAQCHGWTPEKSWFDSHDAQCHCWTPEKSWFDSRQEKKMYPKISHVRWGPPSLLLHRHRVPFCPVVKKPVNEAYHKPPRLRNVGALPPLPLRTSFNSHWQRNCFCWRSSKMCSQVALPVKLTASVV